MNSLMAMVRWAVPLLLLLPVAAGGQERIIDRMPFDRITLDEANDEAVLLVHPIDLPERQVPSAPRPGDRITVRLLEDPDTEYELEWRHIDRLEFYEEMVLAEARELVHAGRFDEAYDHFQFLLRNHPETEGLEAAREEYLLLEARAAHGEGRYRTALARLRELYGLNPERADLETALGQTTEGLVQQAVAEENYEAARRHLRTLAEWYPRHAVVTSWERRFRDEAAALLDEARAALASGEFRRAEQASRRVLLIWPQTPDIEEVRAAAQQAYPRVVVGVGLPATGLRPHAVDDWAARRSGRLVFRRLTEFVAPGSEGGRYLCPLGPIEIEELGRTVRFTLRPEARWSPQRRITAYDLCEQLLRLADAGDPSYRADVAEWLAAVAVEGVYQLVVELQRPHVRPEALLEVPLFEGGAFRSGGEGSDGAPCGPYRVESWGEDAVYLKNHDYFAAGADAPEEIVERHFPEGDEALRALRRGEVDVIDRLRPWDVEAARSLSGVTVEPYAVPLLHCLIPNRSRPLPGHRGFRRAMVYGIHREAILDHLTGGRPLPGARVVSGPFPVGVTYDDPLGYAHNESITPHPYEPRVALALAAVAMDEVTRARRDREKEEEETGPATAALLPLVVAHPQCDIARRACEAIAEQLGGIGISVELRPLPHDGYDRIPDDVDFVYAELAVWEPVVDAQRLLRPDGPAGRASPYVTLALRQLERASDWRQVQPLLRRIHRLAHEDVAVIPLWQWIDHFAYRNRVQRVGGQPTLLYENVEVWQTAVAAVENE